MVKSMTLSPGGKPFPGPKGRLLADTGKWPVGGDPQPDSARLLGRGRLWGEQQGERTQASCSPAWPAVSGFVVTGFVSGLPLANHRAIFGLTRSLLAVYTSQPRWIFDWGFQEGRQDILWGWYFFLDPPKLFSVLVEALCSSSIPTFMKQLMQVVISRPGQAGQFQSTVS